jgi:hypothetical protein
MILFVILSSHGTTETARKKKLKTEKIWRNLPALSPASPGMEQRTAGAKKQAGKPRKATPPWFQSRLRIDRSPHRMQRRTIAMSDGSNKGTKQTKKSKSKRERTDRRKTERIGVERRGVA